MKADFALPRLAARVFGTPLAIERGKADVIVAAIAPKLVEGKLLAGPWDDDEDDGPDEPDDPYTVTEDGLAIVPVCGTLVSKASGLDAFSGLVAYPTLAAGVQQAIADPLVRGILLDFDSPGGEVKGMYDCADLLYGLRGQKPMCAFGSYACSAAYLQASAADQIVVPQDGEVGGIGVIALHCDESGYDAKIGLKYTAIYAGDRKNDGNPHEPLTDEAKAAIQESVDKCYGMFVGAVARNRGITAARVRGTQAAVFMGDDAVKAGLADGVGTMDDALELLRQAVYSGKRTLIAAAAALGGRMPAIAVHHTATSDGSWDGPANEARLPSEEKPLRESHAWVSADGNKDAKASYKFIHHEVGADGKVGAANLEACSAGIAALNGARGGADIPDADREGVHAHLAAHLRDAGKDVPKLEGSAAAAARRTAMADNNAAAITAAEFEAKLSEARKAGYAQALEIVSLCAVAGVPAAKAEEFLKGNQSAQQVGTALLNARAGAERGTEVDPSVHPPEPGAGQQGKAKPWAAVMKGLGIRTKEGK